MTRPELRVWMMKVDLLCGCGNPRAAVMALHRLLLLHPLYEHGPELKAWIPDEGIRYLILYWLDALRLADHGTSIGGAWLTDLGKDVLAALNAEPDDQFEALCEAHCIHGFDLDDRAHSCYDETAA